LRRIDRHGLSLKKGTAPHCSAFVRFSPCLGVFEKWSRAPRFVIFGSTHTGHHTATKKTPHEKNPMQMIKDMFKSKLFYAGLAVGVVVALTWGRFLKPIRAFANKLPTSDAKVGAA
jgi:hypothetical protein